MEIKESPLQGIIIIQPKTFKDERGYFYESYQQKRYAELGLPPFVQDNVSRSKKNVLRGLHFQSPHPQGKLVYVTRGHVFDVVVDIRKDSPTYGEWFGINLNDENHTQMYIPPGFAHGFCVLSDEADFHYKCTDYYYPQSEGGIIWNDKKLNISWPVENPVLSAKDKTFPEFSLQELL
jgi:dTDP-4-dehydrorhamnose 3,5-epimerase